MCAARKFSAVTLAWTVVGIAAGVLALCNSAAPAAEPAGAALFPATTVVFAELNAGKPVLDTVLDHPLARRIQQTPEYRKATETQEFLALKLAVALVENSVGRTWRQELEQLTAGGVCLGIDAETQGVAVVAQASEAELPGKLLETVVALARSDATQKGKSDPVEAKDYREVRVYKLGTQMVAAHEKCLLSSNKGELLKAVLDRLLDAESKSLAESATFQQARQARDPATQLWAFVDVARLREVGGAAKVLRGPVNNPVAELLLGGVIANLRQTPYATGELSLSSTRLQVALRAPHDPAWNGEVREYYFGPAGSGAAPPLVPTQNTLFSLRTYRDLAHFWLRAGDLFNEKINDDFAKAESQLATLFSGKDFGEDILGALKPELQLLVVRQDFSTTEPVPAIKLPAFAAVFELKDPESMQPELRRVFQSLIGFLNVVGAMNGQPQLDLDMEKRADAQLVTSAYVRDAAARPGEPTKIQYNFSPSIAFAGGRFVVSSTKALAQEIVSSLAQSAASASPPVNTQAVLHGETLREVLRDNRGQLISQNMLEKGHSKEAAAQEIDLLLSLLELAREAHVTLRTGESALQLQLQVVTGDVK